MKTTIESKYNLGDRLNIGDTWPTIEDVKYMRGQYHYGLTNLDYWYSETRLDELIRKNNEIDLRELKND